MVSLEPVLAERLAEAMRRALGDEAGDADPVVRRAQAGRDWDYQANGMMGLAKRLGRSPREVSEQVVKRLEVDDLCSDVDVAGPGFINLTLRNDSLASAVVKQAGADRLGVRLQPAERVVVDYSAPNVAKEMHVGHLRSTIIGDAIVRILEHIGHEVVRQNHIGDWGTPFGMLIEHLIDLGEEEAAHELSVGALTAFYQQARSKFDADPEFATRSRQRVVLLQAGDSTSTRLWRVLYDASSVYFHAVYDRLGVRLVDSDIVAESSYNSLLDGVASELEDAGLARLDDGALCAYPEGFHNREGEPLALIIRKTDGGFGYQASDLAAIRQRSKVLGASRLIYVVGAPQAQHLAMVESVARSAGWLDGTRVEHVGFGSVLGSDHRMLRTRAGQSIKLSDLLDEAVDRARAVITEKNPELQGEEREAVARAVGIGAVKYADLSNDHVKDYVFDFDRMLAFEGNTGTYLQHAHARVRSIFRRAQDDAIEWTRPDVLQIIEAQERALTLELLEYPGAVGASARHLEPHRLCGYLFELAHTFTAFYEACPVLRAADPRTRDSRLLLCDTTARVLASGLGLLGMEAPERL